jgi:hypothetical protein
MATLEDRPNGFMQRRSLSSPLHSSGRSINRETTAMNTPETQHPYGPGPLTGIIKFLAIVGLLTIFAIGMVLGFVLFALAITS